jgi:MFS family permease
VGESRTVWSSLVLALCAVGLLLVVPFLFLQGFVASFPVFGTSSHAGDGYLTWAAWLGAGLPLVGVVVAALGRRRGWTWFFGICLVLAVVVAAMARVDQVRHAPPPPPEPRHCVERSGGGNDCPGG